MAAEFMDLKIAWRNVWRNTRRTWLTVSAIAFACVVLIFMLSFQFGSYDTMINSSIRINTGHLQVQDKRYFDKKDIRRVIKHPEPILAMVSGIDHVTAAAPRAEAFSLASSENRTYGVLVTGIDPVREQRVSTLNSLIRKGGFLAETSGSDTMAGALVGILLARNLKVGIGDELTVLGQGRDGSVAATVLVVRGIYQSGIDEFDRSTIHIPLVTFQSVYNMDGAVHKIVIDVDSLDHVQQVKTAVQKGLRSIPETADLVVLDWSELVPGLMQAIKVDLASGLIFWCLLVLVVAFSILNTFLMAVFERTREFGVMMALGTTPGRLVRLLLFESSAMTLVGVALGMLAGCGITLLFQHIGIDFSGASDILSQYGISGRIYPRLSPVTAFAGPLLVWGVTFAVSLYPALKIRRLKPVEAMAHV